MAFDSIITISQVENFRTYVKLLITIQDKLQALWRLYEPGKTLASALKNCDSSSCTSQMFRVVEKNGGTI